MRSDHGLPPWVLSSSFFLSFFSICFSTELAPHFNSLPCVALAATYQIPNLETQPVFFHEGKRNTIADAERTPSSTASIQFILTMLRHRVAKIKLVCVCSDKWTFFLTSPLRSSVSCLLTWRLVILNQMSLVLLLWCDKSSGRNGNRKKKKSVKEFEPPLFCFEHIR